MALIIFPLFIFVSEHYARQFGISLLGIGVIFLIVRLLDGILDPLVGWASDNFNVPVGKRKFWLHARVIVGWTRKNSFELWGKS